MLSVRCCGCPCLDSLSVASSFVRSWVSDGDRVLEVENVGDVLWILADVGAELSQIPVEHSCRLSSWG